MNGDWKEARRKRAKEDMDNAIQRTQKRYRTKIANIQKVYEMKLKIIEQLREEPSMLWGDDTVYVNTDNFRLAHDVSRALRTRMQRKVGYTSMEYSTEIDDIGVHVCGAKEVPGCRLVKRTKIVPEHKEEYYEMVCGEDSATE